MDKLRILTVRFQNEIQPWEIPLFRGAVNASMTQANVLFHNHNDDDSLRYAYPLIQYKRLGKKAAIVCVNEGTDVIGQFFSEQSLGLTLADRGMELEVESVHASQVLMQIWNTMFSYNLHRWLPLNGKNYAEYKKTESLAEKYSLLEHILIGNILSMAKGLGIHFEKQVEVKITKVEELHCITHKGVKMQAFDIEFKSNVSLPSHLGLGKGASMGFGVVELKRKRIGREKIFLLGGMDLEMCTIRSVLEKEGCKYYDKNLTWDNANLSAYRNEIQNLDNVMFVGIELHDDMERPDNYVAIDHHNERSSEDSSLEQVLRLLHKDMNRYQQLVSANDKGYIDGMKYMGATEEEIYHIRRQDRECQGVTIEEEIEAEQLLSNDIDTDKRPLIIETRLTHFSPITDRIYPAKEYVIYNNHELVYYGYARMDIMKSVFAEELREQRAYYGGHEHNQFFGVIYEQSQVYDYKQKIEQLLCR